MNEVNILTQAILLLIKCPSKFIKFPHTLNISLQTYIHIGTVRSRWNLDLQPPISHPSPAFLQRNPSAAPSWGTPGLSWHTPCHSLENTQAAWAVSHHTPTPNQHDEPCIAPHGFPLLSPSTGISLPTTTTARMGHTEMQCRSCSLMLCF